MELTQLDKELLDGLQVLTDLEISRVQAHLAAGLPMQWGDFRWAADPLSVDGCLISTCMSSAEFHHRQAAWQLVTVFDAWATDRYVLMNGHLDGPLLPAKRDRIAALLDMEWSRRHPLPAVNESPKVYVGATIGDFLPAESSHDAIIPSLEAVPV